MSDFTEKTRLFRHTVDDPFVGKFFNEVEIEHIIADVFSGNIQITKDNLFELLNNIVSFLGTFYPDINRLTPGKTDELKLLEKVEHHTSELLGYLDILLNKYGYETWQHIKLYGPWAKEVNTRQSLDGVYETLQMLDSALPIAMQKIKNSPGKKTGNNALQAIPGLIYYLIPIYEKATGQPADKNFHQDRKTGTLIYKGQFLEFVRSVLIIINSKFDELYPNNKDDNPFKICLIETSIALGQHINRTISSIKKKYDETRKELFNFYFSLLLSIQPRS
ncbi:hypothetical protein [Legionella brunensis]|uniref:Uncharacterized protein n=1 Tax=Legionella brunensis TaxID=29422 RepID=A0A0W0SE25_9GAMM|nr:hypothetical protein [Legionella brunensis]KTC81715.1 hypothetical protein Lbru_2235 [Legionella brunensis]